MRSHSPQRGAAARPIIALLVVVALLMGVLFTLLRRGDVADAEGPSTSALATASVPAAELSGATSPLELSGAAAHGGTRISSVKPGVRLRGPGRLDGRVVDRSSGASVAGVSVELLPMPPAGSAFLGRVLRLFNGPSEMARRVLPIAVAVSGADGRFRFEGVRTGTYFLEARGDYAVPESVPRARVLASGAGGPIDVYVHAGGRVVGRVLAPDGSPARNAAVALVPGTRAFVATVTSGDLRWLETATDADGAFLVPGIPPGEGYEITVTGQGFAVSHLLNITVRAGEDTQVTVETRRGGQVTGRVLALRDDGEPVPLADAHLGAVPRGLRNLRCVEEILTTTHCVTGADGTYVMNHVPPGDVDVVAIERTHLPAIGARLSLADGVVVSAEDIVLKPGAMVAGRVVDARGAPVPGVTLRFNLVDWRNFQFDFSLAPMMAQAVEGFDLPKSDAEGRFLAGPIAGDAPYEVTFTKVGFVEHELKHDPEKSPGEVTVVLQRGGAVEGIVMDAARGEPVTSFTVGGGDLVDVEDDAPGGQNPFSGGQLVEDAGGSFRVESVRPGKSALRFSAPGYLPATVDVEVVEGETRKGVIVQLTPGGVVRGKVVDGGGQPVVGAQVVAQNSDGGRSGRRERGQRGGRRGGRGNGMPNGPFQPMMAAGADGVDDIPAGFLPFAAGMGILGDRAVLTNARGEFELTAVEAGTIRVHAFHRDHSPGAAEPKKLEAEGVLENVVIVLTDGGGIVGTVTDRFGRPVPDEIVLAFSPAAFGGPGSGSGGGVFQGSTDAQGNYAIRHVSPGTYFLVATRGDEDLNPATFFGTLNFDLVTVPAGEVVEFDLVDSTAAACRVRGVVTYRGEPAARGNLIATSTDTDNMLGVEFRAAKMLGEGRFEFAGLAPGLWQLQFDGDGPQVRTSLEVPDLPEFEVEVRLPEGGAEGRVVDERTGQPIANAQVALRRLGLPAAKGLLGSMIARDAGSIRRNTNDKGEFSFERLETGEYELVAQTPSWRRRQEGETYAPSEPLRVRVDSNRVERGITVRLLPALGITGRVVGDGAAVEGARVVAVRSGAGTEGIETTRSDAEGRFALKGLAPGTYRLSANADGWAQGQKDDIVVERGREPGDVELALTRGVLVGVRITKGGLPVSGARAQLRSAGGEGAAGGNDPGRALEGFFRGEGASDVEGRVELGRYAPGKYRLEAQRGASRAEKDVVIEGGRGETELRIDLD